MKPTLYPIRYCTGGCANPGHAAHIYAHDPVDGALHAIHLCPGNTGTRILEEMEDGEPTNWGCIAPGLYETALNADNALTDAIAAHFPKKDRWTLTKEESAHPAIRAAHNAKVSADKAWLDSMR